MSCSNCKREVKIVNKWHKLCSYCNSNRLDASKGKKKKTMIQTRVDPSLEFSKRIKNEAKAKGDIQCTGCNKIRPLQVSHIIPRSLRPDLKLSRENIVLECATCHDIWEHAPLSRKKTLLNYEHKINYISQVDEFYHKRLTTRQ
jgi:5-methylcytosine-specific restriction endonuclease McrA